MQELVQEQEQVEVEVQVQYLGSLAVTSCISTTSGRATSCFSSATERRFSFFSFLLLSFGSPDFSSSSSSSMSSSSIVLGTFLNSSLSFLSA